MSSQSSETYICLEGIKTVAVIQREIKSRCSSSLPKLNFPQQILKSDTLLREKEFSKFLILLCSLVSIYQEWGLVNLIRVYYKPPVEGIYKMTKESICPFERREI